MLHGIVNRGDIARRVCNVSRVASGFPLHLSLAGACESISEGKSAMAGTIAGIGKEGLVHISLLGGQVAAEVAFSSCLPSPIEAEHALDPCQRHAIRA